MINEYFIIEKLDLDWSKTQFNNIIRYNDIIILIKYKKINLRHCYYKTNY